ncbi:MAG TPA: undecaprenyl-phosphate alpha-N-acetylglucosaminyl 1-phosphate transferase, partial [Barnesiella sp.]|nr:undecaprenyl-phosphate alpha-N-acetylglucosaminyl 1-phosphate transferase [Barnesiella sp.]
RQKFIVQIFCAILLVSSGLWINNLYGIFGIYELPPVVGLPFTVFTIVFITNAINLIDGIDGLASGLSGIALLFFTILFIYQREWLYAALAIVTLGTIIPFFYYNVFGNPNRGRKIFMGDTGSLTIGFVLSILAIRLSMYDNSVSYHIPDVIVVAFSLLITPVFDVVRVILHRARFGKNIFRPDKNHIHHKFLALGFSHRAAMITILLISAGFAAMNLLLLTHVNINLLLFLDIFIWTIMQLYLTKKINKKVAGSKA